MSDGETRRRLPPGQVLTQKWPVLTYGETPRVDRRTWTFRCFGHVEQDVSWTWEEFVQLHSSAMSISFDRQRSKSQRPPAARVAPRRDSLEGAGAQSEHRPPRRGQHAGREPLERAAGVE